MGILDWIFGRQDDVVDGQFEDVNEIVPYEQRLLTGDVPNTNVHINEYEYEHPYQYLLDAYSEGVALEHQMIENEKRGKKQFERDIIDYIHSLVNQYREEHNQEIPNSHGKFYKNVWSAVDRHYNNSSSYVQTITPERVEYLLGAVTSAMLPAPKENYFQFNKQGQKQKVRR